MVIGWYANRYARLSVSYLLMAIPYYLWLSIHNNRGFDSFLLDVSTLSYYIKGDGVWFVGAIIPLYLIIPWWHRLLKGKHWTWLPTIIVFIVLVCFNEWRHLGKVAFFFLGYWFGKPVSEDGKINVFFAVIVPIVLYIVCRSFSFLDWFPRSLLLVMPFLLIAAFCFDKLGQVVKAPFQFMGKISLESYMANVMLPSVFALVPWVVNGVNLNDGNRLLYLCVVVFDVVLAYFVHILSRPIIRRFLEHR